MSKFPPPCDEEYILLDPEDCIFQDYIEIKSRNQGKLMHAVPVTSIAKDEWDKYAQALVDKMGKTFSEAISSGRH